MAFENLSIDERKLTRRESTMADILTQLATDKNEEVRKAVAENPKTPADSISQIATGDSYNDFLVAVKNPNIPVETLNRLAKHRKKNFRKVVAGIPNLPTETLDRLAGDKVWDVRRAVAENPNTPAEALLRLSSDPDPGVRHCVCQIVARRSDISPAIRLALVGSKHKEVSYVAIEPFKDMSAHEQIAFAMEVKSSGVLATMDKDTIDRANTAFAENGSNLSFSQEIAPSIPTQEPVVDSGTIAADIPVGLDFQDLDACLSAAQDYNTPADVLSRLSTDDYPDVRQAVAENPNTSLDVLGRLAVDKEESVRRYVAHNQNTPIAILADLAKDDKRGVRLAVANNTNTPSNILEELSKDGYDRTRMSVAANPNTPADVLIRMAGDKDPNNLIARRAIADRNDITPAIRFILAADENNIVSGKAIEPLKDMSAHELMTFISDIQFSPVLSNLAVVERANTVFAENGINLSVSPEMSKESTIQTDKLRTAANIKTPPEVLAAMAFDPEASDQVKALISLNRSTPYIVNCAIAMRSSASVSEIALGRMLDELPDHGSSTDVAMAWSRALANVADLKPIRFSPQELDGKEFSRLATECRSELIKAGVTSDLASLATPEALSLFSRDSIVAMSERIDGRDDKAMIAAARSEHTPAEELVALATPGIDRPDVLLSSVQVKVSALANKNFPDDRLGETLNHLAGRGADIEKLKTLLPPDRAAAVARHYPTEAGKTVEPIVAKPEPVKASVKAEIATPDQDVPVVPKIVEQALSERRADMEKAANQAFGAYQPEQAKKADAIGKADAAQLPVEPKAEMKAEPAGFNRDGSQKGASKDSSGMKQLSLFDVGLVVEKPKDNQKELSSTVFLMNKSTGNGERMGETISRCAEQAKQVVKQDRWDGR